MLNMFRRLAAAFAARRERALATLREARFVASDETGARIEGVNAYHRVFHCAQAVVHHYGRREVVDWCEDNASIIFPACPAISFFLPPSKKWPTSVPVAHLEPILVLRGYAQTNYASKSWRAECRVCARIEPTEMGL